MAAGTEGRAQVGPVQGTQSLVQTLSQCWKRPSLTALEILWRWTLGVPTLVLVGRELRRILAVHTEGTLDVTRLGLDRALLNDPVGAAAADPMGVTGKVSQAVGILLPDLRHLAVWLVPLLLVVWVFWSSLGRTVVLHRVDQRLHARPLTLMGLQAVRTLALAGSLVVWFFCVRWAVEVAIRGPIAAGNEPNLVEYFAVLIVSSLGIFTLWAVVSWVFSVAPLIAMLGNLGPVSSLAEAFRLGALKSKLMEVNLVLGIIKIILIVLAMVFSATPLPFETETTPEFMAFWWVGVSVFYLVASDYFHVVRQMAYLGLWRVSEGEATSFVAQG